MKQSPHHHLIRHIVTLHRIHAKGHKRYRESPLSQAIDELVKSADPPRSGLSRFARMLERAWG